MPETKNQQAAVSDTLVCEICGAECSANESLIFEEKILCLKCVEEKLGICDHCHQYVWIDDSVSDNSNHFLCTSCYDSHYISCSNPSCGSIISLDDLYYDEDGSGEESPYCYHCYSERQKRDKVIHSYCYKPDPIFYGEGLYLGVELEVDGAGESSYNAERILDIGNKIGEHIYIKHDGSLDDGFEIVSMPCTLKYHQTQLPWKAMLQEAISMGYLSDKAKSAGLHVHVDRQFFGKTSEEQDPGIARLLYFVEAHWGELLRFSRRTEIQMNRWASRYGYRTTPREIMDAAKYSNLGRFTAVNLTNYSTVEIRMFRGTLKYQSFIAALQLTDCICRAAVSLSDEQIRNITWNEFVLGINPEELPELIEYLKLRRLYVNEPVAEQEEI